MYNDSNPTIHNNKISTFSSKYPNDHYSNDDYTSNYYTTESTKDSPNSNRNICKESNVKIRDWHMSYNLCWL